MKLATSNLVHKLGLGLAYQKRRLGAKLVWVWARGASEKNVGPLRIFATVEASIFKFGTQNGFGSSLPKNQRLGPKLAGVWARGASRKIWDPLLMYATVEASNFKFGTQLGFGTSLANNNI